MPDHEDSLGGETFSGEEQQDPAEQSLGDGATMGGDTAAHSLGDQSTFGDANVDDELFDDGMEIVDLSTRYTEESVLGKGGFGEVMLATDTRLGRKVAIKRIQGKAARSKKAVQRFLTEAKSIAGLNHNNIVQIYDYGRATDGPFLIMESVEGGSLLDLCRKGPIELDEAVSIFSQVCDGLAKAHAENIIHRDIKPANILMTEDGVPKLTDFGLAKDDTSDTGMTMEGAVIGTPDFMPPEQRKGAEFTDHRSDLWSLAATFYQMLTGKSPKVINISSIPPKLQSVVAKALEESKEDRFQSAMEMREAILQSHSGKMDTSRSLGEGECPECATLNPPTQKFCRECSGKLQVSCLKCEQDMAIWDKGCGECGTQQQPLVKRKFNQLQKKHDAAEQFLQELNFEEAETSASAIAAEEDSRLQNFKSWHEEFSQRLVDTRKTEHERLKELLEEAKTHEETCDYEAARRSLNNVDKRLKDHELEKLGSAKSILARMTSVLAKITKLSTANDTVKEQALSFLEEFEFNKAIEAAREIETDDHPHLKEYDAWVYKFRDEVQSEQNAAYKQLEQQLSQALEHEENYDYEAALGSLNKVDKRLKDHYLDNIGSAKSIGARITEILARIKKLSAANDIVKEKAVSFLGEFAFDKAIEAADGIQTDAHPHLKEYDVWVKTFSEEVRSKQNNAYKQLEEQLTQVLEHESNFDYDSGLKCLAHVDRRLFEAPRSGLIFTSNNTAREISERLTGKQKRVDELEETIRVRFTERQLPGLLPLVCELDELRPNQPRIEKLKSQLSQRKADLQKNRDEVLEKATLLIGKHMYAEALNILATVSQEARDSKLEEVRKKSHDLLTRLNTLREKIATKVNENQLDSDLISDLVQCLALKPDQADLVKLRQELVKRDAAINAQNQKFIAQIKHNIQHAQFETASHQLSQITADSQTVTTGELTQQSLSFSIKRKKAIHSGTAALDGGDFELAISVFNSYQIEIESAGIQDQELQRLIKEAKSEQAVAKSYDMLVCVGKMLAICCGYICIPLLPFGILQAGFSSWTSAILITICWTVSCGVAYACAPTRFKIILRLLVVSVSFFIIYQTLLATDQDFAGRLFLIIVFIISWLIFIQPEDAGLASVSEKLLGITSIFLFGWLCYLTWAVHSESSAMVVRLTGSNPIWGEIVLVILFLCGGFISLASASDE